MIKSKHFGLLIGVIIIIGFLVYEYGVFGQYIINGPSASYCTASSYRCFTSDWGAVDPDPWVAELEKAGDDWGACYGTYYADGVLRTGVTYVATPVPHCEEHASTTSADVYTDIKVCMGTNQDNAEIGYDACYGSGIESSGVQDVSNLNSVVGVEVSGGQVTILSFVQTFIDNLSNIFSNLFGGVR